MKKSFGKFLNNINLNANDSRYTWINMSICNVFLKIEMYNREYLLCMIFPNDIYGMVSFKMNRYFEI